MLPQYLKLDTLSEGQIAFHNAKVRNDELAFFDQMYPSLSPSRQIEVQRLVRNEGYSIFEAFEAVGVMHATRRPMAVI
jgi:hypothetical protein